MTLNIQSRVIPISILNVRIFLVRSQHGYALIDTGIPFLGKRIEGLLKSHGVALSDIKTILLTHGHLDHIGCLSYIKSRSGAVVVCHRSILSALESGEYEKAIPRVLGWRLLNPILSTFLGNRLNPVHPDRVVDDSLDLKEFGLNGTILHTPGHSPGSCSIFLDSGICLVGDLLREPSPGIYDTGLFYHDRGQILTSLKAIAAQKPKTIYLSHGTTMRGIDLEIFIDRYYQRFDSS